MLSRYYIFYPAWEDEYGKITPLLTLNNGNPASILERSSSFIEYDAFKYLPMLDAEDFDVSCEDYFGHSYDGLVANNQKPLTYVYKITEEWLEGVAKDHGIVSGYIPIDDVMEYYKQDYKQEYFYWNMPTPISSEALLTLPKEKQAEYVKFTHLDTYSAGYICNILLEVLNDIYVPWEKKGKKIILLRYSF